MRPSVLITVFFLLVVALPVLAQVPAFPGAEGFGSTTPGGRGGRVLFVTTLNASGAGSLKEAIESTGPRIVIFQVGGTIDWGSIGGAVNVRSPFITICGQTAPGDGITIKNGMLSVTTHDVVVRGLRFRVGDARTGFDAGNRNGIDVAGANAYNVIFDHCSISWAIDENAGVTGGAHDVTIQYCYVTEGLNCSIHPKGCHSKGLMANHSSNGNISFHHNVLAHNVDRNPQLVCPGNLEAVNNIVANFSFGGRFDNDAKVHFIGNRYIPGPNTNPGRMGLIVGNSPRNTRVYVEGNIGPGRPANTGDEWAISDAPASYRSASMLFTPTIEPDDVDQIWPSLLDDAGALPHDDVDERMRSDVLTADGGWIDSQNEVGGWPQISSGVSPTDSDNDGIPDDWEIANGLNRNNPGDASLDLDGDGYTNIEDYVNGLLLDGEGTTTATGKDDGVPSDYVLNQNFPNPFNPSTTIGYTLAEDSHVKLAVYDVLGQDVVTLVDGEQGSGYRQAMWLGKTDANTTAESGVYFYRIEVAGQSGKTYVEQKKMILVK
jgi:hypothetical protein